METDFSVQIRVAFLDNLPPKRNRWLPIFWHFFWSCMCFCCIAGNFFPTARALIGYFEVIWHLTMNLFPAKISGQATLQKCMTSEGNIAMLPANVDRWPPLQLQNFQLYNKTLKDWSLGKQLILFPSNLNAPPWETLRSSGNKINCFPRYQSLSV